MTRLERRCRAVLRAYPRTFRAERGEELLATLLDANEGRRAPRLGDVADVVGHGLAQRVRCRPGERARLWADAGSVAVAGAYAIGNAIGVALLARMFLVGRRWDLAHNDPVFVLRACAVVVLGLLGVGAVVTGRQALARVLAGATATGAVAAVVLAERPGAYVPRDPWHLAVVGAGGAAVVGALLLTGAVRRAASLVPRAAWVVVVVVTTGLGLAVAAADVAAGAPLRITELALVAYAACAFGVLLLALPLWTARPRLTAAAALLCVPAAPGAMVVWWLQIARYGRTIPYGLPLAAVSALVPWLVGWAALRRAQ